MHAIIFGSSGAVGTGILTALGEYPTKFKSITVVGRSKIINLPETLLFRPEGSKSNPTTIIKHVIVDNFETENWSQVPELETNYNYNVAFYSIGTQSRKVDAVTYKTVELVFLKNILDFLIRKKVSEFHYISSSGASPSSIMSALRIKFEAEAILGEVVGIGSIFIYRPGGVLTQDGRGMHPFLQLFARITDPFRMWSLTSETLGRAIIRNSGIRGSGNKPICPEILEHHQIIKLGMK